MLAVKGLLVSRIKIRIPYEKDVFFWSPYANFKEPSAVILPKNLVERSGLIDLRRISELVVDTNGKTWDDETNSRSIRKVISVFWFDEMRTYPIPVQWLIAGICDHAEIPVRC